MKTPPDVAPAYDEDKAITFISRQTGFEPDCVRQYVAAMRAYEQEWVAQWRSPRVWYDPDAIFLLVFEATTLPVWKIIRMIVADVEYMISVGLMGEEAGHAFRRWEREQLNETDGL